MSHGKNKIKKQGFLVLLPFLMLFYKRLSYFFFRKKICPKGLSSVSFRGFVCLFVFCLALLIYLGHRKQKNGVRQCEQTSSLIAPPSLKYRATFFLKGAFMTLSYFFT